MSNISSDTLYHFTNWDNLVGILENGFYPRHHLEKLSLAENETIVRAIPMVSFCDVPLSQIKNHVERYGSYGIGMSKNWADKNKINPVLYLKQDSSLSINILNVTDSTKHFRPAIAEIGTALESLKKQLEIASRASLMLSVIEKQLLLKKHADTGIKILEKKMSSLDDTFQAFTYFKTYMKQDEGYLVGKGKKDKVKFYDEREWRYVPPPHLYSDKRTFLSEEEFNNPTLREQAFIFFKKIKLKFKPNSIKYIIIKEESEILEMIKELEKIKGSKYPANVIKRLTSRIITYEQIANDF